MRLEAVENNNFDEVVDLLKFGKCVFELPRNSFSVQLKSILKDLYPNESEIPPEVGKMFISADELLNLIEKNDFRDLIKESVKTLFDWITKNLNKDVDLMMSKKRQVDEVAKCLSVLQKSSFFKSVDLQHAVDGFVKHLMMNQLEMDEQNYSIEKEVFFIIIRKSLCTHVPNYIPAKKYYSNLMQFLLKVTYNLLSFNILLYLSYCCNVVA